MLCVRLYPEFGRSDFAYVINTHFHFDHLDGNQVFPEAEVVAHELNPQNTNAVNMLKRIVKSF